MTYKIKKAKIRFPKDKCQFCGSNEFVGQYKVTPDNKQGDFVEMYCSQCDKTSPYHTKLVKGKK